MQESERKLAAEIVNCIDKTIAEKGKPNNAGQTSINNDTLNK